jgi:hypothetical protein
MQKLLIGFVATLLAGCAVPPTPNYDAKFGDAVRQARQMQTLNPDAGTRPPVAVSMDGKAANESMVRYHDSFKAPPPVTNVINIGGSIGGGGK